MKTTIARTVGIAAASTGLTLFSAPTASAAPDDLNIDISGTAGEVVMGILFDAVGAATCTMWVTNVDSAVPVAVVGPEPALEGEEIELRARVSPGQYMVQWGCFGLPVPELWGTAPPMSPGEETAEPTIVTVTEGSEFGSWGSSGSFYGI
ncbi:hypothetical protein [Rhodococcus sp. NPDC049939]|uniref:hypothetical protein n=1 Tax=Rhodococcus sp. NPDC049939 TaxID=3155511 RepID=UPI0033F5D73B